MDRYSLAEAVEGTTGSLAGPPVGMLAELTHRCPLQCPYCSNPIKLLKAADELDTETWLSVFAQAADLGVLQAHLSGGEPTLRQDLEDFVALLATRGVYTNLITAGVNLTRERIQGTCRTRPRSYPAQPASGRSCHVRQDRKL